MRSYGFGCGKDSTRSMHIGRVPRVLHFEKFINVSGFWFSRGYVSYTILHHATPLFAIDFHVSTSTVLTPVEVCLLWGSRFRVSRKCEKRGLV